MVAEIWASVISSFVDQLVALNTNESSLIIILVVSPLPNPFSGLNI